MKMLLSLVFSLLLLSSKGQEGVEERNLLLEQLKSTASKEQQIELNLALGELLADSDTSGIGYCRRAIFLINELSIDKEKLGHAYGLLAKYLNSDVADSVNRMALYYANSYKQDTLKANLLLTIGNAFLKKFDFDSAYSYYQSSLHIFDSLNLRSSALYMSLGKATSSSFDADLDLAISYMKRAEEVVLEEGNAKDLDEMYSTIGYTFYKNKWLDRLPSLWRDSALVYLNKSIVLGSKASMVDQTLLAFNYRLVGLVYTEANEFEKAQVNFDKALQIATSNLDEKNIAAIYDGYGLLYSKTGRLAEAKEWVLKGMKIRKKIDPNSIENYSIYLLYDISLRQKDYKSALTYFQRQEAIKDSIFTERRRVLNEELEVRYETELQKAQNKALHSQAELQEKTISSQRTLITFAIVGFVVVVLLGSFIYRQLRVSRRLTLLLNKQNLELKETKETVETQRDKLVELDSSKSRFFSNISHDLRSPLTLILNAFEEIKEQDYHVLEKSSQKALDIGSKNGKRLLHLADEIMELTQLEEGKIKLQPKLVAIAPYTKMLTKMLYSAADIKFITLTFNAEVTANSSLWLDPHQYEKIFYNLLSNAIKFTPTNGSIDVNVKATADHIVLTVADSGSGICKESIDRIFDRYYQSNANDASAYEGVGIGLALVKELVELHNGLIEVASSSKGSSFRILFPRDTEYTEGITPLVPESALAGADHHSLWTDLYQADKKVQVPTLSNSDTNASTILIVEDHKEILNLIKKVLSDDYRVCEAPNGWKALAILENQKIDMIVTDLMMPSMDGFEFINKLKAHKTLKKIPVLVLSARTDQSERLSLLQRGTDAIMSKPFHKQELLAQVANLLAKETSWDSQLHLNDMSETVEEYEKEILSKLETLIVKRIDDQSLTVLDLAAEMAASESKMFRFVKSKTGLSPLEYIKEIRWQFAKKYIENNHVHSLIEVARKIGMNNATYFKQQYTKRFGKPPMVS